MTLGANTKKFFDALRKENECNPAKPMQSLSPETVNKDTVQLLCETMSPLPHGVSEADFKHTSVQCQHEAVPLLVYTPKNYDEKQHATIIFFYGGGFVCDLLRAHYAGIATLANMTNCQVIAIDYPLAPKVTAETMPALAYYAVLSLYEQADHFRINSSNLILSGFSAGGNLASVVAYKNIVLGSSQLPIKQLLLFNPWLDLSLETHRNTIFHKEQSFDEMLTTEMLVYFSQHYLAEVNPKDPTVSPLYIEKEVLKKFPPVTCISAEYDRLRGDTEALIKRLDEAGVSVTQKLCEGQAHGFFIARAALDDGIDPAVAAAEILNSQVK
ncbi:MAG: hypothetical protein DHS20C10_11580 [marine bacterium B5-7]|nr:MAG: hypothetical protein DHS20C10_11580 [marine bacterium B5-7]